MSEPVLHPDFTDLLVALQEAEVHFLIVGAHALAVHGVPRATGDLDVFVSPDEENAERVMQALESFGAPLASHGVTRKDFRTEGTVYQIGVPPRRIDVMTSISGVHFDEAERAKLTVEVDGMVLPVLGRQQLLANKLASGRPKDLVDVRLLKEVSED